MEKRKELDKELIKRTILRANRLTFGCALETAKGIDAKLDVMKDLAQHDILQNMDREGLSDSALELIDDIIADYGQNPKMRPVDEWD